jgi:hypothetical protein
VHENADHNATYGTARKVQRGSLIDADVSHESPLRKEVRRELHAAAKARAYHRCPNAAIEAPKTLCSPDLLETVEGASVAPLDTDR